MKYNIKTKKLTLNNNNNALHTKVTYIGKKHLNKCADVLFTHIITIIKGLSRGLYSNITMNIIKSDSYCKLVNKN